MNFKRYHVSKNLFDEIYSNIVSDTPKYKSIYVGDGDFTLSTNCPRYTINAAVLFLLAGNVSGGASTPVNGVSVGISKTVTAVNGYVTIAYRYYPGIDPRDYQTMLNLGSTPQPYEPYSSEVWHDTPHYIHKTDTDTIATPADIYANDTTATVGLKGNMSQSSTPSPTTPIQPSECGERTGNLFDEIYPYIVIDTPKYKSVYVGDGNFTLSTNVPLFDSSAVLFLLAGNVSSGASTNTNGVSVGVSRTVTAIDGYVTIAYRYYTDTDPRDHQTMLNEGSTALPYEPYGQYKIPISSAGQTTPVYLGEVETTRKIKKLVLTGEEAFTYSSQDDNRYVCSLIYSTLNMSDAIGICSHFVWKRNYEPTVYNRIVRASNTTFYLSLAKDLLDEVSANGFKAYLAAQYANGTPVCVWYVLAEPTTGIVNEPLRKIGDYADEVSGITIPTIAGANTLSIGTALQPSEVTATYKGWHPVQSVHERENGAWT